LLPGLIDMHGHVTLSRGPIWELAAGDPEANLRAYLYAGVTTVLDPSDSTGKAVERREQVARREIIGPTVYTSGKSLTCPGGHPVSMVKLFAPAWIAWYAAPRSATQVGSREEAFAAVDDRGKEGTDVIKVVADRLPPQAPRIPNSTLEAIDDRARERESVESAGSRTSAVPRMRSIRAKREPRSGSTESPRSAFPTSRSNAWLDSEFRWSSRSKWRTDSSVDLTGRSTRLERETVPENVLDSFYPLPEGFSLDALGSVDEIDSPGTAARNMMRLRQAGVTILAGSDSQGGGIFPGAALHRELGQLVRACRTSE
jgi:hypothetical protein